MSETVNPLANPEQAAHEVILELIRAGRIKNTGHVAETFTSLMNYYNTELNRIRSPRGPQVVPVPNSPQFPAGKSFK